MQYCKVTSPLPPFLEDKLRGGVGNVVKNTGKYGIWFVAERCGLVVGIATTSEVFGSRYVAERCELVVGIATTSQVFGSKVCSRAM